MQQVAQGFFTIGVVIALGALSAHLRLVGRSTQEALVAVSFYIASPALLISVLANTDARLMFTRPLAVAVIAIVLPGVGYLLIAHRYWRDSLGEQVIALMCATYVNSGYLGIPVATYVLGDAAWVAPVLVLQTVLVQPLALAILDLDRHRLTGTRPWQTLLTRPLRSPLTIGAVIGVTLSISDTQLPALLADPVDLLGAMAVPTMLLAYGISLRLGPGFAREGSTSQLVTVSAIKLFVQPLLAYAAARWAFGMSGHALFAVTVTAALPTAQNIFAHATRYSRGELLARDTILVTTLECVPVIGFVAWALT